MTILILASLVFLFVALIVGATTLFGVSKIFKIKTASYKESFKIIFLLFIFGIIINVALIVINKVVSLGIFSELLVIVAYILAFEYLLKKYYKINWKRILGICAVFFLTISLLAVVVIVPIRLYVFSPFVVSGYSMSPNFNRGDYLLIKKFDRKFESGDVVVYRYPKDTSRFLVHRIIGIPSDKLEIRDGGVYLNGKILKEGYITERTSGNISITLKKGEYFVLGDNRSRAFDSRKFGVVPEADINGKIFYKISGLMN